MIVDRSHFTWYNFITSIFFVYRQMNEHTILLWTNFATKLSKRTDWSDFALRERKREKKNRMNPLELAAFTYQTKFKLLMKLRWKKLENSFSLKSPSHCGWDASIEMST